MANDNPQLNGIARRGDVMARGPSGWGPVPLSTLLQSEAESVVDANFTIIGSADASKKLKFEVDAQTTGKTATINTGAQTADRTVTLPVLAGNDTLAAVGVANTFSAIQVIDNGSGALPAAVATNMFRLATVDAAPPRIEIFGFGTTALNLRGRIAAGTRAALTAATDGLTFFTLNSNGYDGASWSDGGAYNAKADGLWSGSNHGMYHEWTGIPNGSTVSAAWMKLQNTSLALTAGFAQTGAVTFSTGTGTNTLNGNVTVTTGKTITAVSGIIFSNETLSQYDEGTWTPVVAGDSVAGTQTYSVQNGHYVRIGKMVWCDFYINMSALGGTTAGNIYIGGLPFTVGTGTNYISGGTLGAWGNITLTALYTQLNLRAVAGSTFAYLGQSGSAQGAANIGVAGISATTDLRGTIQYEI